MTNTQSELQSVERVIEYLERGSGFRLLLEVDGDSDPASGRRDRTQAILAAPSRADVLRMLDAARRDLLARRADELSDEASKLRAQAGRRGYSTP